MIELEMSKPRVGPSADHRIERLWNDILRDAPFVAAPSTALAAARDALLLDEVLFSSALAGYRLDPAAGKALLARGVAIGGHRLEIYEAVADYADAARFVAAADLRRSHAHPFLRSDDILELHRRAAHRTGHAPGAWRERNVPAVASGLVPPPHWLVPREVAAFVDRYAPGPPEGDTLSWVAGAHARILRIQPFDAANGRVARLTANLLLRRLGLPAASFGGRRAERYPSALAAADSGDAGQLAVLTAEAVHESITRLMAALTTDEVQPLRTLASPERLGALVKAAQRGRLRVVRRGTRFYSTKAWLEEYEREQTASRPS